MSATADAHPHRPSPLRDRAELILSRLDQLPSMPAVAMRLLALTASSESSARDVVRLIESDASLTAAILKLVNRADLGVRREGMTVERAVKLLGFSAVRNAALTVQVYGLLADPAQDERLQAFRRELWKHNLAVACAADRLAAGTGAGTQAGDAFVCGLLHDIGKIALDACLPKSYARVVDRVERRRQCIVDVENELLGIDHTVAGKRLGTRWRLPSSAVECIWLHHQHPSALPSSVQHARLVALVHLADHLVRRQHIGFSGYQHVDDLETLAAQLDIDAARIARVAAELPAHLAPLCALMGIDEAVGQALYAESLAKANHELARANTELHEANRRLDARAACFDGVRRLAERLTERDQISDVCVTAADVMRTMMDVGGALVFLAETPNRCLHLGLAQRDHPAPVARVTRLDDGESRMLLAALAALSPAEGLVAAPEGCDLLWQRHAGGDPTQLLWLLPFAQTEDLVGGLLFAEEEPAPDRFRAAKEEWQALAATIRLAVATARARTASERLHEEALELNRRYRTAEKELVRARSVSMIAEMAAGAAHELNNPLSVIAGRAQMELQRCEQEELARTLNIIIEQSRSASQIVTDLMHFAKPDPPTPVQQRLAVLLESHCQRWRQGFSLSEQQVLLIVADENATVYADAGDLQLMLDAIVANAVEARAERPVRLQINSPSLASDETVRIVVEDNGVGMTRECLEHAIDPFYSNRPAGRRRGLGLSRAYRLAEVNGGNLWLDSTPGVGTTVTLELPACASGG